MVYARYTFYIDLMKRLAILMAMLLTATPGLANNIKEKRAEAYKEAKSVMSPDLYLVYRVADRIITTNEIKRPIRVAVRNNVDQWFDHGVQRCSTNFNESQWFPMISMIPKYLQCF